MAQAGVLELQLVADVARLRQDMERMQGIVSKTAKGMQQALEEVQGQIKGLFGGASVVGFGMWIKGAIDFQDHLNDLNKTTGISVDKLGGLALMANQSGTDLEGLAKAINKMSLEMGKAPDKFAKIGITAKDPIEAFKQLSDIFVGIEDPQLRAAVAAGALGKSWASAAPALAEGSKSIDEMVKRGAALSGVTAEGAKASDEFNDRLAELQMSLKGASILLANDMLPLLGQLVVDLTATSEEAKTADAGFNPLTEALRALIVVGGNVAFVFRAIGIEIGGLAAQAAALAHGDFAQIGAIHEAMAADAEKNRTSFDAWEQKILSVGKSTKESGEEQAAGTHVAKSALQEFVGVNKEAEAAVDSLMKKIQERIAASKAEVTLGRQLSDEEKFRVKTEADFQELLKKFPGLSHARIAALLAESAALSQQLDIRKAEQAANTEYAKAWAKEQEEMAAADKARGDERNRVLAGIRDESKALEDSNAKLVLERALIGASSDARELATGSLDIELKLKRQIEEINQNLLLDEQARAQAIVGAQQNAAESMRQLGESIKVRQDGELSEDFRGAVRDGLQAGFQDGKNPAKAFADSLASAIYSRVSKKLSDAITDALFGKGSGAGGSGGGLNIGGLLSGAAGLFGGAQASFSQTSAGSSGFGSGLAYGNQDMGAFLHSGGIVGSEATFGRSVSTSVFDGAPRFHTGGIAGDEVPIIAQRGEGVFTAAQMKALGGGGGGTANVTQNIMVGEFTTPGQMREELKASERRTQAGFARAVKYGMD